MHRSPDNGVCWFRGKQAQCEMNRLASDIRIPDDARKKSQLICCGVVEKGLLRMKSLPVIAAASVYAACRESEIPVTIKELSTTINSRPCEVARAYRSILLETKITPPVPNGTEYVLKVASGVGASEEATELSLRIAREAVRKGLGDRRPMTVAAAAVYNACLSTGQRLRQYEAAEAAGVSEVSVRECTKAMRRLGVGSPGNEGSHDSDQVENDPERS